MVSVVVGCIIHKYVCCHKLTNLKKFVNKNYWRGVTMSPWLSALSALERRLLNDRLDLRDYRALTFVHELNDVKNDQLAMFIAHNQNIEYGNGVIKNLIERGLLQLEENSNSIILTSYAKMVIDELDRLCKSRLVQPLFVSPNR